MGHKEPSKIQVSLVLEAGTWHFQCHDLGSVLDQVMWFGHEDVAQWPEGLLSMLEARGLIPHTA